MSQNTYVRTIWVNDSEPPLNADNLNKIEQGIVDAHIHMAAKNNPHGVTTEQIGAATEADLNAHVDDKNNPHGVTTEQIGAATEADLNAHVDDKANPHQVTHDQTNPEGATIGADTQRVKHVSDKDFTNWEEHRGNKANPHEVTHDQTNPEGVDLTDDDVVRNKHISNDDGKRWNDHIYHPNPHSNHETPEGAQAKVDAHANRTDNPHNVTAVQIGAVDIAVLTAHEENPSLHLTPELRAALDHSEYPPTGENPVVTATELHNAMAGSVKRAVGTAAELSAIPPTQRRDRDMRLVEEEGKIYRFDAEATEGDIPPDEGSGYWIAVASATQSHNNLSGIQGGDANLVQYYHLSHDEYINVTTHHDRIDNPHEVTAVQVGAIAAINGVTAPGGHILISQQGEDLETVNDPEAGTILLINNHNGRKDNPHQVTHAQVGPMPVEYGPDETRDKHLSNSDYARWEDHLANKSNPHAVTAAQIGAIVAINGITAPGGQILISQQGEDLETVNDLEARTILLINNHNGRKDNPHEVTHDQVAPMPVEYGPDETRDKHISDHDFAVLIDHLHSSVAHGSTPENMEGRIIRRDAEGRAKVSDPKDDDDIATKGYVDQSLSSFGGVTDAEKAAWNAKWDYDEETIKAVKVYNAVNADTVNGKTVAVDVPPGAKFTDTITTINGKTGVITKEDIVALGIPAQDTVYTLPTASSSVLGGVKVGSRLSISSNGVLSADIQTDNNFTDALKAKLEGIEAGANKYILPTASSTVLGGIRVGDRLSISNGVLSADKQTDNNFTDALKTKLDGIEAGANKYTHPDTHPASMITGLHSCATTGVAGSVAWDNVTGKPSTFTPSEHTHEEYSTVQALDAHTETRAALNKLGHVYHATLTATLNADGWTGTNPPFTQVQTVSGIIDTDVPIVDVVLSGDWGVDEARLEAWGYVYRIVTNNNSITAYAREKPEVALPLQLKVVR